MLTIMPMPPPVSSPATKPAKPPNTIHMRILIDLPLFSLFQNHPQYLTFFGYTFNHPELNLFGSEGASQTVAPFTFPRRGGITRCGDTHHQKTVRREWARVSGILRDAGSVLRQGSEVNYDDGGRWYQMDLWLLILIIVIAVLVLGGGGWGWSRRR
jgi:hypothetical protein